MRRVGVDRLLEPRLRRRRVVLLVVDARRGWPSPARRPGWPTAPPGTRSRRPCRSRSPRGCVPALKCACAASAGLRDAREVRRQPLALARGDAALLLLRRLPLLDGRVELGLAARRDLRPLGRLRLLLLLLLLLGLLDLLRDGGFGAVSFFAAAASSSSPLATGCARRRAAAHRRRHAGRSATPYRFSDFITSSPAPGPARDPSRPSHVARLRANLGRERILDRLELVELRLAQLRPLVVDTTARSTC